MNDFQHDIGTPTFVDYSKLIAFDEQKGFFCPLEGEKTHCLGISKVIRLFSSSLRILTPFEGRKYPDMPEDCRKAIDEFYAPLNSNLKELLTKHELPYPSWLK